MLLVAMLLVLRAKLMLGANVGSDAMNQKLSENRAKAVMDYLVGKGVDQQRLRSVGYGKTRPIDTNDTEQGRANNRRTMF